MQGSPCELPRAGAAVTLSLENINPLLQRLDGTGAGGSCCGAAVALRPR